MCLWNVDRGMVVDSEWCVLVCVSVACDRVCLCLISFCYDWPMKRLSGAKSGRVPSLASNCLSCGNLFLSMITFI